MRYFLILQLLSMIVFSCSREEELFKTTVNSTSLTSGKIREMGISPYISQYNYLGSGYDVTKKFADDESTAGLIIDLDRFSKDFGLYKEKIYSQEYEEYYGENAIKYTKSYTKTKGGSIDKKKEDSTVLYGKTLSMTLSNTRTEVTTFDAKYIYGSYHILIKQNRFRFNKTISVLKNYLTKDFKESINSLSPENIVKLYGTHLLVDIFTGARMDMTFQAETHSVDRLEESKKVATLGLNIFGISNNKDISHNLKVSSYNKKVFYKTRGGDPSRALIGSLNFDNNSPNIDINSWQNTSTEHNAVLIDVKEEGMVPIYELIEDPVLRNRLKAYIKKYLYENRIKLYQKAVPIYRYYNSNSGDHFYTTQINLPPFSGYMLEGEAFKVLPYKTDSNVPIYSYFNGSDHFYSPVLIGIPGYVLEGVVYYASLSAGDKLKPVYWYFHTKNGDNFYTTNFAELGTGKGRYVFRGIAYYVY